MHLSMNNTLKSKEFHCDSEGPRRVDKEKGEYLSNFIGLVEDIKKAENKEDKKEKDKKKGKKGSNIKKSIEDYFQKMVVDKK